MKTEEEFKTFYSTILLNKLETIEVKRKSFVRKCKKFIFFYFASLALFFLAVSNIKNHNVVMSLDMMFIFCFLAFVFKISSFGSYLDTLFKQDVMPSLINFIDSNLEYFSGRYIPSPDFDKSCICGSSYTNYEGCNLVTGKIGKTEIAFSELSITNKNNNRGNSPTPIFFGMFFVADFNKKITGQTLINPFLSLNNGSVKLESSEFEKYFRVYSTDQIEARYILSESLMQRMINFRKKINRDFSISFIDSQIYVAFFGNIFKVNVFSKRNTVMLENYYHFLTAVIGIVEDLNLNTQIWTKNNIQEEKIA